LQSKKAEAKLISELPGFLRGCRQWFDFDLDDALNFIEDQSDFVSLGVAHIASLVLSTELPGRQIPSRLQKELIEAHCRIVLTSCKLDFKELAHDGEIG
jgi:hypothetical protein